MRWIDRLSPARLSGILHVAWIALVVAAFYRENGVYFLTKVADFARYFRASIV